MAKTPQATRIMIDPAFSDGYESNQSGELGGQSLGIADIQSPIDLSGAIRMEEDWELNKFVPNCGVWMSPNAVDRFERLNGDAVSGEVTLSTF